MNNLICRSSIEIPEELKDSFWVSMILTQLTRSCKRYDDPTIVDQVSFFEVKDSVIRVPRLYPIHSPDVSIEHIRTDGKDINIEFKSELRNDLQRLGLKYLIENDSGILKLKPGEGKTVIAIAAVSYLKKKTIVFMHKDSLVTQWKERFLQHSTLKDEDISVLSTASHVEDLEASVVLSTVQTMCSMLKRIPNLGQKLIDANFGIGIWDECHTTGGAHEYSKSCYYIPAKKCFGLSATPGRSDHNDDIIGMHLGSVYEPEGQTDTLSPRVVLTYFNHYAVKTSARYVYYGFPDKDGEYQKFALFDGNRYKQMLYSKRNEEYIKIVKQIINFMYKNNRTILVICDRIKLLDKLAEGFPKDDVGFFIPRTGKERDSHLHRRLVFSTPGSSRDGTDRPEFDCLIMATPLGNLDQAIGRVCRAKVGKPQPIVIDLVDTGCDEMTDWGLKRKEYYTEKVTSAGWKFEEKYLK